MMTIAAVAMCFAACKNEAASDGQKAEASVENVSAGTVKAVTMDDMKALAEFRRRLKTRISRQR